MLGALCALASGSALDAVGHIGLQVADEFKGVELDSPNIEDELDAALEASKRLSGARIMLSLLRYVSLALFGFGVLSIANNMG